ncbi:hypothetical protein B0I35DRAFT_482837 [Stachybotrys elegans]|uniref:Uncharacterized protein n=1 Tax=Stachybotrys elegans TaxID=80388 RepID=A0A8K0SIM9_9HYPO|nr:hypothetical protein B0I35DRAFT_482837 [Stachybotrys elegans]
MRIPQVLNRNGHPTEEDKVWLDLAQNGFHYHNDPISGIRIDRLVQTQTPLTSINGLRFFNSQLLHNHELRPILLTLFERFGLLLYRSHAADDADYCYKTSARHAEQDGVIVHLISSNAKVSFWNASHRLPLTYERSDKNLWHVPRSVLEAEGLTRTDLTFKQGGFIITDPRTCFNIQEGFVITIALGERPLLERFGRVDVVWNPEVERMIQSMESNRFTMNVRYVTEIRE